MTSLSLSNPADIELIRSLANGNIDDYQIVSKIGQGKYSMVFLGIQKDGAPCGIKILKLVRFSKIVREIQVLKKLQNCPNIPQLIDVVQDPESDHISLILEWCVGCSFRNFIQHATYDQVRLYFYKILLALDSAHQMGIMHRDIKPSNIMFDVSTNELRLIDWGLADFYKNGQKYQVRVSTRNYKPPEILLNYPQYDLSLDIWSLGCTIASIVFKKYPFFSGQNNDEILIKISQLFGFEEINKYAQKFKLTIPSGVLSQIQGKNGKGFSSLISNNPNLATPEMVDLLLKMLVVDHTQRISSHDALQHSLFDSLRTHS